MESEVTAAAQTNGAQTNGGHPAMNNSEDVNRSGQNRMAQTGYKRFRRRGNSVDTNDQPNVPEAVVAEPSTPTLILPELSQIPAPVVNPLEAPMVASVDVVAPIDPVTRWNALRQVTPGARQNEIGSTPLVSFNRDDPASKAFDQLRTRLLQTLRSNGWSRIAIAAPTPGCGSTFTAVNLGLSLARIPGSRTVLMDMNLRTPGIARALDVHCTGDMRGFLSGDIATSKHMVRIKDTLALGLANQPDLDAAELLHDQRTAVVLQDMQQELHPDVVLYDLPPILAYDDLAAFLPQVDGVLLVSDGTKTIAADIEACERVLEGQTKVLGVILNQARGSGLRKYDA